MDHRHLLANIERLLLAKGVSADAICKKAKRIDAIRNLRRTIESGAKGSWTLDTLADIADALETTPWELLKPAGAAKRGEQDREFVRSIVREELGFNEAPARRKIKR